MIKKTMIDRVLTAVVTTALFCGTVAFAQTPSAPPASAPAKPPAPEKAVIPLKVQITLSRFEGEKKTASLPFTLWVNANDRGNTSLDVGIQVPTPGAAVGSIQYRTVGTSIICSATSLDDGRLKLTVSINDSSVIPNKESSGTPSFQSLQMQNTLLLRDGQNAQFVAATDKVTGDVTKVDVTVSVLK